MATTKTAQRVAAWLLCACVAILAAAPAARASGNNEALEAYVERTGELLDWAGELVAETESSQAREVLRKARDMHEQSGQLMRGGRRLQAQAVARRARDAVWHAVRLARESMGLDERIRLHAERFRDQHRQLTDRAREMRDERALDFLDRAERQAGRARERLLQGDQQMAWRLQQQADDLLRRAARFLAEDAGPERLAQELERTRTLIDQTRGRLEADAPGAGLLSEAEDALTRALQARDEGRPGVALQMNALARRLALRAREQSDAAPDAASLERLLARFDDRLPEVAAAVSEADSEPARRRLDDARRQRELAGRSSADGKPEQALRQIRSAHDLLDRARELARR